MSPLWPGKSIGEGGILVKTRAKKILLPERKCQSEIKAGFWFSMSTKLSGEKIAECQENRKTWEKLLLISNSTWFQLIPTLFRSGHGLGCVLIVFAMFHCTIRYLIRVLLHTSVSIWNHFVQFFFSFSNGELVLRLNSKNSCEISEK